MFIFLFFDQYCCNTIDETTFHEYNDKHDYEQCFMRLLFICAHEDENSKCNNKVIPL